MNHKDTKTQRKTNQKACYFLYQAEMLFAIDRRDLIMNDTLESIVAEMQRIVKTEPFVEKEAHRAADTMLIRALGILVTEENKSYIQQLLRLFQEIPKHYQ